MQKLPYNYKKSIKGVFGYDRIDAGHGKPDEGDLELKVLRG